MSPLPARLDFSMAAKDVVEHLLLPRNDGAREEPMVSRTVDRRAFSMATASLVTAFGAAAPVRAEPAGNLGISSAGRAIHQEVRFRAGPAAVYGALTDPGRFDRIVALSGAMEAMKLQATPCEIS